MRRNATGGPSLTEVTDEAAHVGQRAGRRPLVGRHPLANEGAVGALEGDDPIVGRVVDVEEVAVADGRAVEEAIVEVRAHVTVRWTVERVVGLVRAAIRSRPG